MNTLKRTQYLLVAKVLLVSLLFASFFPAVASAGAGTVTARKLTLGSSAISASTTHKFDFTLSGTDNLGPIKFEYCTAASGACGTVTGLDVDSVSLSAQTGATGFSLDATTTTATVIGITRTAASASGAVSYTFSSATNPSTTNNTFYVRITTYTANNFSGSDDTGTVAASTAQQITLTGTMDESLVFCVGASGANCSALTSSGGAVSFNDRFSSTTTRYATSEMIASTNGVSGYVVTINGSTLTCSACSGTPTIAAMGTQSANGAATTSSTGSAQFGLNFRNNATPDVGADKSGGSGDYGTNYGTVDNFRFFSADTVASATGPSDATQFTASYIVNVPGSQAAGTYTATMTYIATATF
jgi:hypothetical protein